MNAVVPLDELEETTVAWCREMLAESPLALRLLKAGYNAAVDGLAGVQQLSGDATLLYYMSEEAQEGRDAYVQKRAARLLEVPEAPVSTARVWWRGARPRTLVRRHRAGRRRRAPPRARACGSGSSPPRSSWLPRCRSA